MFVTLYVFELMRQVRYIKGCEPRACRKENYTTVDPKLFVFFKIETRPCDVQSWETNVKDCKAETDTAVQSGRTHLKKELRSPNTKPFGELFFKCEHDAGHAAQSAGS